MDAQSARTDNPEQLIEVFKAAALSVTKLYKSSVAAETRARSEGYQECLDDLLGFLDRDGHQLAGGLPKLRRWIAERREGGDVTLPTSESEDEVEKAETTPSNNSTSASANSTTHTGISSNQAPTRAASIDPAPVEVVPIPNEPPRYIVPSQESFTFTSDHQYPNIATLDLSDGRSRTAMSHHSSRQSRNRSATRNALRVSNQLGRGAGTKRRMDFDDFFGGCFGGKDTFGNGPKRRHM
ncbi:unnamed protein product [Clonostachys rosea f. rosea IK726]|jgi:hypothetical protein|uniref:Uncharacterized protein n=2 Tax=Bionectria ochroleuca TaxID=29856 RepID=A0A0B7K706_BIOOC|nr:unnamed protein product [Clonostachys rosea f. rosea IK726]